MRGQSTQVNRLINNAAQTSIEAPAVSPEAWRNSVKPRSSSALALASAGVYQKVGAGI